VCVDGKPLALTDRAEPDGDALADRAHPDADALADRAVPPLRSIAHRCGPGLRSTAHEHDRALRSIAHGHDRALRSIAHGHERDADAHASPRDVSRAGAHRDGASAVVTDAPDPRRAAADPATGGAAIAG
jgi:hypothetical protein